MKASQFLISTLKEAPADAEVASHRLMTRAGDRQAVLAAYGQAMPDAEVPEALVSLCERLIQGT